MSVNLIEHNTSMPPRRREEFKDNLIESIEEVLNFSKVVINYIELSTSFTMDLILDIPEMFSKGLEDLFGSSASSIEDLILERLYSKLRIPYQRDKSKSFEENIEEALSSYSELQKF